MVAAIQRDTYNLLVAGCACLLLACVYAGRVCSVRRAVMELLALLTLFFFFSSACAQHHTEWQRHVVDEISFDVDAINISIIRNLFLLIKNSFTRIDKKNPNKINMSQSPENNPIPTKPSIIHFIHSFTFNINHG